MWQPYTNRNNWTLLNNHEENVFRLRYVTETIHDVLLLQTSRANNWNSLTYMEQLVWELSQCWWSSCKFSSTCYLNFISVFTIKKGYEPAFNASPDTSQQPLLLPSLTSTDHLTGYIVSRSKFAHCLLPLAIIQFSLITISPNCLELTIGDTASDNVVTSHVNMLELHIWINTAVVECWIIINL